MFNESRETTDTGRALSSVGNNANIRTAVLGVLVLLGLFLAVQVVNDLKEFRYIGSSPTYNAITVNGTGEVLAVPDIATFSFSVIEEAASAADAQNATADKIQSIISFIREQGIEEKDIKTTSFNLYPRYEFRQSSSGATISFPSPPSGERQLVGFEVNQTVEVKVRDTGKAGQLIAGVSELGASNVSGLRFTIDDEDVLKTEARAKAIADAKARAEVLADELDVRLVRVISYGEFNEPPIFYGARGLGGVESAVSDGAFTEAVVPSGENRIVSNVSITYEIR